MGVTKGRDPWACGYQVAWHASRARRKKGAIHHVTARGVARRPLFRDDRDRLRYLRMLGLVVVARAWRCLSYCLMDNHIHLLLETPTPNLALGMQRVHGDYGRSFNRRHGLNGHVFQGRYDAVRVRSDRQLWVTAAYIADNPVEAGLCATGGGLALEQPRRIPRATRLRTGSMPRGCTSGCAHSALMTPVRQWRR